MADYFVDWEDGDNADDGTTAALAKLTVEAGLALLSGGDTLYIKPGVYNGETWANVYPAAASSRASQGNIIGDYTGAQSWPTAATGYVILDGSDTTNGGYDRGTGDDIPTSNNWAYWNISNIAFLGFQYIFIRGAVDVDHDSVEYNNCIFEANYQMAFNLWEYDDTYPIKFIRCRFINRYHGTSAAQFGVAGCLATGWADTGAGSDTGYAIEYHFCTWNTLGSPAITINNGTNFRKHKQVLYNCTIDTGVRDWDTNQSQGYGFAIRDDNNDTGYIIDVHESRLMIRGNELDAGSDLTVNTSGKNNLQYYDGSGTLADDTAKADQVPTMPPLLYLYPDAQDLTTISSVTTSEWPDILQTADPGGSSYSAGAQQYEAGQYPQEPTGDFPSGGGGLLYNPGMKGGIRG